MKTIDDILKEQGFNDYEKKAFMEMINEAKLLQRTFLLEDLKEALSTKINEVTAHENTKH